MLEGLRVEVLQRLTLHRRGLQEPVEESPSRPSVTRDVDLARDVEGGVQLGLHAGATGQGLGLGLSAAPGSARRGPVDSSPAG